MSASTCKTQFIWSDIHDVGINGTCNTIVMNPPFHSGKAQSIELGLTFINKAHHALKKGGTLYMVANNHLPYEVLINQLFSSHVMVAQENGFKVISAKK